MKYLTANEVGKRYNVSRSSIDRWRKDKPGFPRAINLSERCLRWRDTDLDLYDKTLFEQQEKTA